MHVSFSPQHPQHSQHSQDPATDDVVTTPVHIERDAQRADRLDIVEDEAGRVLACGFASPEAARRWVQNHNRLSGWHKLELTDA